MEGLLDKKALSNSGVPSSPNPAPPRACTKVAGGAPLAAIATSNCGFVVAVKVGSPSDFEVSGRVSFSAEDSSTELCILMALNCSAFFSCCRCALSIF